MNEPTDTQKPLDEGGVASAAHCSAIWRVTTEQHRPKGEIREIIYDILAANAIQAGLIIAETSPEEEIKNIFRITTVTRLPNDRFKIVPNDEMRDRHLKQAPPEKGNAQ